MFILVLIFHVFLPLVVGVNQVLQILTALVIHLLMISTLVFFSNHIQSGIQNRIQNPHSLHLDPQPQLVHLFDYHRVSACEILHREYLIGVRFPKNQDFSPTKLEGIKAYHFEIFCNFVNREIIYALFSDYCGNHFPHPNHPFFYSRNFI